MTVRLRVGVVVTEALAEVEEDMEGTGAQAAAEEGTAAAESRTRSGGSERTWSSQTRG